MNQEHLVAARKAAADRMNAASKAWRENPTDDMYKAMLHAKGSYNDWVHTIVVRGGETPCYNRSMAGERVRGKRR